MDAIDLLSQLILEVGRHWSDGASVPTLQVAANQLSDLLFFREGSGERVTHVAFAGEAARGNRARGRGRGNTSEEATAAADAEPTIEATVWSSAAPARAPISPSTVVRTTMRFLIWVLRSNPATRRIEPQTIIGLRGVLCRLGATGRIFRNIRNLQNTAGPQTSES